MRGTSKDYKMINLGMKGLVGRHVRSARINEEKDLVILETDKGQIYLTWEGECCAHCYLAGASGTEALREATIVAAENAEWTDVKRDEREFEVVEKMGTKIQTSKGRITLESRLEHNGYYGGEICVSDDEPMDQYRCPRYDLKEEGLPPTELLKDF